MCAVFFCHKGENCPQSEKCFMYNDTTYTIHDGVVTWYDAVTQCSRREETLAVISSEFLNEVSARVKPNVWIGLRQKEYYIDLCHQGSILLLLGHPLIFLC